MFVNEIDPSSSVPLDPALALRDEFDAAVKARRDAELRCARVLAQIGDTRAWEQFGCASVGEFGERNGLAADEARALLDLGRAIRTSPLLEQQVIAGRITVAAASCVAAVLAQSDLLREEDDWIGWAQSETVRSLRRRVRRRREEVRIGEGPACPISVLVSAKGRDDFDRAREIASHRAGRALTHGETFETVVDHYLNTFDEDRVAPGQRRTPPIPADGSRRRSRYVPMAVRREIYERQGHECAVPFCGHTMFLEKAHLVAHASGGDREADNLVLLCSTHHWFLDSGSIKLAGTAAKPQFFDSQGQDMAKRLDPGGSQPVSPKVSTQPMPRDLRSRSGPPTRAEGPPNPNPAVDDDSLTTPEIEPATGAQRPKEPPRSPSTP